MRKREITDNFLSIFFFCSFSKESSSRAPGAIIVRNHDSFGHASRSTCIAQQATVSRLYFSHFFVANSLFRNHPSWGDKRLPCHYFPSTRFLAYFIVVQNYFANHSLLEKTQIFFCIFSVFSYHYLSSTVFDNILTSFSTIGRVYSGRYASGKDSSKKGNQPLRSIKTYYVDTCPLGKIQGEKCRCKFYALTIVFLIGDGHPFPILFDWKSFTFAKFLKCLIP